MDTSLEYSMHTLVLQTRKTGWVARPLLAKFVPIYPTLNLMNQESRPARASQAPGSFQNLNLKSDFLSRSGLTNKQ